MIDIFQLVPPCTLPPVSFTGDLPPKYTSDIQRMCWEQAKEWAREDFRAEDKAFIARVEAMFAEEGKPLPVAATTLIVRRPLLSIPECDTRTESERIHDALQEAIARNPQGCKHGTPWRYAPFCEKCIEED